MFIYLATYVFIYADAYSQYTLVECECQSVSCRCAHIYIFRYSCMHKAIYVIGYPFRADVHISIYLDIHVCFCIYEYMHLIL